MACKLERAQIRRKPIGPIFLGACAATLASRAAKPPRSSGPRAFVEANHTPAPALRTAIELAEELVQDKDRLARAFEGIELLTTLVHQHGLGDTPSAAGPGNHPRNVLVRYEEAPFLRGLTRNSECDHDSVAKGPLTTRGDEAMRVEEGDRILMALHASPFDSVKE